MLTRLLTRHWASISTAPRRRDEFLIWKVADHVSLDFTRAALRHAEAHVRSAAARTKEVLFWAAVAPSPRCPLRRQNYLVNAGYEFTCGTCARCLVPAFVEWVEPEAFWPFCSGSADGFVGCEAPEGLQVASEVVGRNEVGQVLPKLGVVLVILSNRRLLQRPVHPFDLSVIRHDVFGAPDVPLIFGSALW
jgi:hypothetical protein